MHEWTNRARVDPQLEMAKCGGACGEAACAIASAVEAESVPASIATARDAPTSSASTTNPELMRINCRRIALL